MATSLYSNLFSYPLRELDVKLELIDIHEPEYTVGTGASELYYSNTIVRVYTTDLTSYNNISVGDIVKTYNSNIDLLNSTDNYTVSSKATYSGYFDINLNTSTSQSGDQVDGTTAYFVKKMVRGKIISGSMSIDAENTMRRSLSLNMSIEQLPGLTTNTSQLSLADFQNKKIKAYIGLKNFGDSLTESSEANGLLEDSTGVVWFKLGIFNLTDINLSHSVDNLTLSITAQDKTALLKSAGGQIGQTVLFNSYGQNQPLSYKDTLIDLLTKVATENPDKLDINFSTSAGRAYFTPIPMYNSSESIIQAGTSIGNYDKTGWPSKFSGTVSVYSNFTWDTAPTINGIDGLSKVVLNSAGTSLSLPASFSSKIVSTNVWRNYAPLGVKDQGGIVQITPIKAKATDSVLDKVEEVKSKIDDPTLYWYYDENGNFNFKQDFKYSGKSGVINPLSLDASDYAIEETADQSLSNFFVDNTYVKSVSKSRRISSARNDFYVYGKTPISSSATTAFGLAPNQYLISKYHNIITKFPGVSTNYPYPWQQWIIDNYTTTNVDLNKYTPYISELKSQFEYKSLSTPTNTKRWTDVVGTKYVLEGAAFNSANTTGGFTTIDASSINHFYFKYGVGSIGDSFTLSPQYQIKYNVADTGNSSFTSLATSIQKTLNTHFNTNDFTVSYIHKITSKNPPTKNSRFKIASKTYFYPYWDTTGFVGPVLSQILASIGLTVEPNFIMSNGDKLKDGDYVYTDNGISGSYLYQIPDVSQFNPSIYSDNFPAPVHTSGTVNGLLYIQAYSPILGIFRKFTTSDPGVASVTIDGINYPYKKLYYAQSTAPISTPVTLTNASMGISTAAVNTIDAFIIKGSAIVSSTGTTTIKFQTNYYPTSLATAQKQSFFIVSTTTTSIVDAGVAVSTTGMDGVIPDSTYFITGFGTNSTATKTPQSASKNVLTFNETVSANSTYSKANGTTFVVTAADALKATYAIGASINGAALAKDNVTISSVTSHSVAGYSTITLSTNFVGTPSGTYSILPDLKNIVPGMIVADSAGTTIIETSTYVVTTTNTATVKTVTLNKNVRIESTAYPVAHPLFFTSSNHIMNLNKTLAAIYSATFTGVTVAYSAYTTINTQTTSQIKVTYNGGTPQTITMSSKKYNNSTRAGTSMDILANDLEVKLRAAFPSANFNAGYSSSNNSIYVTAKNTFKFETPAGGASVDLGAVLNLNSTSISNDKVILLPTKTYGPSETYSMSDLANDIESLITDPKTGVFPKTGFNVSYDDENGKISITAPIQFTLSDPVSGVNLRTALNLPTSTITNGVTYYGVWRSDNTGIEDIDFDQGSPDGDYTSWTYYFDILDEKINQWQANTYYDPKKVQFVYSDNNTYNIVGSVGFTSGSTAPSGISTGIYDGGGYWNFYRSDRGLYDISIENIGIRKNATIDDTISTLFKKYPNLYNDAYGKVIPQIITVNKDAYYNKSDFDEKIQSLLESEIMINSNEAIPKVYILAESEDTNDPILGVTSFFSNYLSVTPEAFKKDAFSQIVKDISTWTTLEDNITIDSLPLYIFDVNKAITINDSYLGIKDEYLIKNVGFSFDAGGSMSLSGRKMKKALVGIYPLYSTKVSSDSGTISIFDDYSDKMFLYNSSDISFSKKINIYKTFYKNNYTSINNVSYNDKIYSIVKDIVTGLHYLQVFDKNTKTISMNRLLDKINYAPTDLTILEYPGGTVYIGILYGPATKNTSVSSLPFLIDLIKTSDYSVYKNLTTSYTTTQAGAKSSICFLQNAGSYGPILGLSFVYNANRIDFKYIELSTSLNLLYDASFSISTTTTNFSNFKLRSNAYLGYTQTTKAFLLADKFYDVYPTSFSYTGISYPFATTLSGITTPSDICFDRPLSSSYFFTLYPDKLVKYNYDLTNEKLLIQY